MIVIYTPKVTNRIKYTFDFVFSQYFGIDYTIVHEQITAFVSSNIYINYSKEIKQQYFNIVQHDLLLETHIAPQELFVSRVTNFSVFFKQDNRFDLSFDIFSSIFYLIARYEEYLPHQQDTHGRYLSSNSILAHADFRFAPVVEYWLLYFKQRLEEQFKFLNFKKYHFEYLPTFDIDNAYKFKGRNWFQHFPNFLTSDFWKYICHISKDKYDVYDDIFKLLKETNSSSIFFFLLNDEGKLNSKVSPRADALQQLINTCKERATIGIHPSYLAPTQTVLFDNELDILATYTGRIAVVSRQHFLRVSFPHYYRELSNTVIQTDYSLAYPDVPGFRAGCSRPFYFFDIELDTQTHLKIQASCWMDATYAYYQTLDAEQINLNFLTLFNQLIEISGILVPIFHNDLLASEKYWGVFKFINKLATSRDELKI
ncbi:MAG TPA: hypothetical protein PLL59_03075 [Chitinophagales bacterium]|nr:hypothetical protein [Chitinophagales bacterium]